MLRAILFDLGGTLIYPQRPWPPILEQADRALAAQLVQHGLLDDDEFAFQRWRELRERYSIQRIQDGREYTYHRLLLEWLKPLSSGDTALRIAISEALRAFFSVTRPNWQADEEAHPVLRELRLRGYLLGLLSNAAEDEDVQALVDRMGFRPFFDFVLSSAACGYRKPHPYPFQQALAYWNLPPSQVVMIGDTLTADILGANRLGMVSVWVRRHAVEREIITPELQPHWTVERLGEVLDAVGRE